MFKLFFIFTTFTTLFFINLAQASSKTPAKVIAGWVEKVVIENQNFLVKAKLDSGAKTSSIYAEEIELIKKDGKKWVKFTLVLEDEKNKTHRISLEKPRARRVKVKEHDGIHDSRPVVELDLCFDGRHHTTQFTLADRKEYIYPVLLGRRFLDEKVLIDSSLTFNTLSQCP